MPEKSARKLERLAQELRAQHGRKSSEQTDNRFLPLTYAAERLSISKSWLYKHHRELPFIIRIGGRMKVSRKKLNEWMKQKGGSMP